MSPFHDCTRSFLYGGGMLPETHLQEQAQVCHSGSFWLQTAAAQNLENPKKEACETETDNLLFDHT